MKKLFYLLIIALGFQSCGPTIRQISRNCDKYLMVCGTEKETVIEYRDTTIYIDKLIEVPVPFYGDSVSIRDSVNVITVIDSVSGTEKHVAQMDTTYKEFGLIGMQVWVNNSGLGADAWLLDSTIWWKYQDWIKVDNAIKESKEKVVVQVKYIPGFYKFTFWFFITVVLVVVFVGFRAMSTLKGIVKDLFD